MADPRLVKLARDLEEATLNRKAFFVPYAKQMEFCDRGMVWRERLLMAGNQVGKTTIGAYEAACHLTGIYPDWWLGKRFEAPTRGWIAGETSVMVRDKQQALLCGQPGVTSAFGTGFIPKKAFVDKPSLARGVTDAYDTIFVQHASGGVSTGAFKSYEQGRAKFQSDTIDWGWGDEESDEDIYNEFLTRLKGDGMLYITFTPLRGRSKVVLRFMDEPSADRGIITLGLSEVTHFSEEEKRKRVAGYAAHERAARESGVPLLGSGAIFTQAEGTVTEAPLTHIPPYWCLLWGIDIGIDHPFAAVLIAWDKDNDVIHVLHTVRFADGKPINHAVPMKVVAARAPVAWPQDAHQRDKGSLDPIAKQYKAHGLSMLPNHATWPGGGSSTEAAVMEIQEREANGKIKYASQLSDLLEERRFYHRKDGQIVHIKDDIMSALQKAIMMKRHAKACGLGGVAGSNKGMPTPVAEGVDFDVFDA